jgi:diaminopimelate decarboxylase
MTFGGMFIRYYPDVYVKNDMGTEKVRSQISVDDYIKIHS